MLLPSAATSAMAGTYSSRVLTYSPYAYLRLNETSGTVADDSSTNNRNGTYTGGVTLNQAGAFVGDTDVAANFDGTDDRVTLGTISPSGSALTIIAWIRPANFTNANARIIAKASDATEANTYWMLALDNSSGSQRFAMRIRTGGATTTLVATSGTLATNTWYMLAAVYDGSNMRLYLDSQPVGSVAKTGSLNTGSINAWIGRNPDSTNAFAGRIDDVAIISSALTQAQINELYVDSGRALVGHWAMNENTGQTTADSSGNGLTMTLGTTTSSESSDPTWTTSSKLGAAALTFDGTADSLTAANNALMSFTSEITITAWIRTTTVASGQRAILNKGTNYGFAIDGSNLYFAFYNGSTIGFTTTSLNLKTNVWYHVAATFHNSGDRVRIYLNGTQVQSWTTTNAPTTDSSAMTIGSSSLGTYWNGTLDDVRVYNRELSAAQIAALGNLSLIGHWKLDETSGTSASDISGNANTGTLTGLSFSTDSKPGRDSTGVDFAGNDYISIADHASLKPTAGLTITAWIKGDSWGTGSNVNTILRKGTDNPNNYQLAIASSRIEFGLDGNDDSGIKGNTTLQTGTWYHVAATWDGSNARVYLNGVLDMGSPTARSGTIGTDTRPLYIGGRASADYFDGMIDDVRIYNYALSDAEIRNVYGLLGYWKFDETSPATTAADSSGNGFSAPRSGNTAWTTGRVNGAAYFDGSGDFATTSSSFATPPDGTIAFWMKSAALTGTQRILGNGGDWEIRQAASGVITFDIAGDIRFETAALQANKWYHLAAMFDDTNDKYALYVNGTLYASGTQTFTPQAAATMSFGTRTGSTEYWNGTLDEVYIYNRRMTATEVQELYNGAPALGVHILKWNEVQ